MRFKIICACLLALFLLFSYGYAIPDCITKFNWIEPTLETNNMNIAQASMGKFLEVISISNLPQPIVARHLNVLSRAMYEAGRLFEKSRVWKTTFPEACVLKKFSINYEKYTTVDHFRAFLGVVAFSIIKDLIKNDQRLKEWATVLTDVGLQLNSDNMELQIINSSLLFDDILTDGSLLATIIINEMTNDGSNYSGKELGIAISEPYSDYTGYEPINPKYIPNLTVRDWNPKCDSIVDINRWVPLAREINGETITQVHEVPYWGFVKPFAPETAAIHVPPPPKVNTDTECGTVSEVLDLIYTNGKLTEEQMIAASVHQLGFGFDHPQLFTPAGQWMYITFVQSIRKELTTWDSILLFLLQAAAQHDAAIAAWRVKTKYDSARPITRIQCSRVKDTPFRIWKGPYQGFGSLEIRNFTPYYIYDVVQPASSGYVSAHSTASFAGAEVLREYFQNDELNWQVTVSAGENSIESECRRDELLEKIGAPDGKYAPLNHITLNWNTYTALAEEISSSRQFSGAVFPSADIQGRKLGKAVGSIVFRKVKEL